MNLRSRAEKLYPHLSKFEDSADNGDNQDGNTNIKMQNQNQQAEKTELSEDEPMEVDVKDSKSKGKEDNKKQEPCPQTERHIIDGSELYPDLSKFKDSPDTDDNQDGNININRQSHNQQAIDTEAIKPVANKERIAKEKSSHIWCSRFIVCAVLIVIVAILSMLFYRHKRSEFVDVNEFGKHLEYLRMNFTRQSPNLWTSIRKLGVNHLEEVQQGSAIRPLVFLLVSNHKNGRILKCLSKNIALAFSKGQNSIDGSEIARQAHSKKKLDNYLEKILKSAPNGETVAIVTNIGSLSYDIASIFFKYCDTEGSPYPNAVFLFTLAMDIDVSSKEKPSKLITQATWNHLSHVIWKDGTPAQRDALIARIIDPAPILVLNEDETIVQTCPPH